MAGSSNVTNVSIDDELREIERIIDYKFTTRDFLSCSLGDWSPEYTIASSKKRQGTFVRMGLLALDAITWKLYVTKATENENVVEPHYHRDLLVQFVMMRRVLTQDENLVRVAHECGLLPYLEKRQGKIGPKVQAIIGAVLVDAESRLPAVEKVLKAWGIIDSSGSFSIPGSTGSDWGLAEG